MGKRNRQRRAANQRARRQSDRRRARPAGPARHEAESVDQALLAAARATQAGDQQAARCCAANLLGHASGLSDVAVQQVATTRLEQLVTHAWGLGWQPADLQQVTLRRLGRDHAGLLAEVIAAESAAYSTATVHPSWRSQLVDLGAVPPPAGGFARALGVEPVTALSSAIELLGLLMSLPQLPRLLPPPGTARSAHSRPDGAPVDERALARVRALLSKAESTEFPDEAEALSAKAQELMARYSLERLLVESADLADNPAAGRRLWLEAPYAGAKALLVQSVADANRCRTVWSSGLGFVTVMGDVRDLVIVELLSTSLLLQATRAMVDRNQPAAGHDRSRTRSFRHSFLVAYATRIGERLRSASEAARSDVSGDQRLLPVLAANAERVEQICSEMFPRLVRRGVAASNALGWSAGLAAADLARLDANSQISAGSARG